MKKRKMMALFLALCVAVAAPVCADGQVLYDEGGGERLEDLLEEDAAVWPTVALPTEGTPEVKAKGAVLMDLGSGQVLFEKEAHTELPIASVTKVMTLLLTMEDLESGKIAWTDPVTCSETVSAIGGSQIWLEPGEVMTVEELVKAAVVVSANDACGALAEHLEGSIPGFVARMNARAAELGMEHTRFKDCSGLDDTGYSCAYDVALMSRELMTHPEIERFTTIWMDTLRDGKSQLVNTNKLVRHYKGATGLKTGTTSTAGHCLSATARREDTAFVAVVLGCATTADRWAGARALLDYGFAGYTSYTPPVESLDLPPVRVIKGQQTAVAIAPAKPGKLLLPKGAAERVVSTIEVAEDLQAPVLKGQTVGVWRLMLDEEILAEYPIYATGDVPATTFRWAYGLLLDALLK